MMESNGVHMNASLLPYWVSFNVLISSVINEARLVYWRVEENKRLM